MIKRALCVIATILIWTAVLGAAAELDWMSLFIPYNCILLAILNFEALRGAGVEDENTFRIGIVDDDGSAVQTVPVSRIRAEDFPIIRYEFEDFSANPSS
jgi:hypothetical protein